jgi:WD40 repeat protein
MRSLICSSDGIFVGICDKIVYFCYNISNDSQIIEFTLDEAVGAKVTCLAISQDGCHIYAGFSNKWICCWEISSGKLCGQKQLKKKSTTLVDGVFQDSINHTSRKVLLAADRFGEVYAVDLPLMSRPPVLCAGHTASVITDMVLINNRFLVTADRDEKVRIQCFPNILDIVSYCLGHSGCVSSIDMVSDDLMISCGFDHKLILWQYVEGKIVAEYEFQSANSPLIATEAQLSASIAEDAENAAEDFDNNDLDDSNAGNYPLKVICYDSADKDTTVVKSIAVIFKGLSTCQLFDVVVDQTLLSSSSYTIKHKQTLTLPSLPSDCAYIGDNQILFLMSKPCYNHLLHINESSSGTTEGKGSTISTDFRNVIKAYCAKNGKLLLI